jgi:hypothetical protein
VGLLEGRQHDLRHALEPGRHQVGSVRLGQGPAEVADDLQPHSDAGLGPLDLLAAVETPSGSLASWHQRVLPGIAFKAGKAGKGKTVITVTDAGKALGGVKVTVSKKGYASLTKRLREK